MSKLHVNQIAERVSDLFSKSVPQDDLNVDDKQREVKVLTRCLAAFSIYSQSNCSIEEAANSVVDGADDNGLDAIYYNATTKILYIAQAKWIQDGVGEPDSGEIAKFCKGIRDLVNSEWENFNKRVTDKRDEVDLAIQDYELSIRLILAYTGSSDLATHGQKLIDELLNTINDTSEIVKFDYLNQLKLHQVLSTGSTGAPITLEFGLSSWGKVDDPLESYYGTISGEEVAAWWKSHGDRLFAGNLRGVLGKTEVNQEVASTIANRADDFWFFNNGVTVVASSIAKNLAGGSNRDIGSFKAENASIVNGAQTVSTIGRYAGATEHLQKVRLLVRVISLSKAENGADYAAQITRTNNTQNRIEARDFVTQDPEQSRLKRELALEGVTYNLVRSETTPVVIGGESIDLHDATVGLACAKADPALAVLAKRNIGQFWADTSKSPYKTIFNPSTSPIALLRSVRAMRAIDLAMSNMVKALAKRSGKEYGLLIHGNRFLAALVFSKFKVGNSSESAAIEPIPDYIGSLTAVAYSQSLAVIQDKHAEALMGNLFKNTDKCKTIFDVVAKQLAAWSPIP